MVIDAQLQTYREDDDDACQEAAGTQLTGSRLRTNNKGDANDPEITARLVAQQMRR